MRLFFSGLRKLVRRPASWVSLGMLAGLLVLILLAVSATVNDGGIRGNGGAGANGRLLITFPGAYDRILQFVTGLGGLFAVIYGAAIAGSEWSWGTLKAAVARGESRVRYMLISYGAVSVMIAVGVLVVFAIGVAAAIAGANIAGISTGGLSDSTTINDLPQRLARGWFAVVEEGALGFTIATLARSQLAGIGAGIAFYFGESFAALFLPDVVKYLPFSVASASLQTGGTQAGVLAGGTNALPPDQALLFVALWLVGALVVTAVFSDRAEIAG
jgi:ABC-type transport system involved in multi-copper enzyme maturation permease subunit